MRKHHRRRMEIMHALALSKGGRFQGRFQAPQALGQRLRGEGETSTNTMCPQDCQEWCASQTFLTGQSLQGQPPPRMLCLLSRAAQLAEVKQVVETKLR